MLSLASTCKQYATGLAREARCAKALALVPPRSCLKRPAGVAACRLSFPHPHPVPYTCIMLNGVIPAISCTKQYARTSASEEARGWEAWRSPSSLRVRAAIGQIMLAKVPWELEEVS